MEEGLKFALNLIKTRCEDIVSLKRDKKISRFEANAMLYDLGMLERLLKEKLNEVTIK